MISLKQWMELVDYRITEGSDYHLAGKNLFSLTSWNGRQSDGGYSMEIVFDQKTQDVYVVEACDYSNDRAYRLINSDIDDVEHDKTAWDDVKWTDLDVADDFIEKATAIIAGEDYDTRVQIQLDIPHDLLYKLMLQAHEADMTLNEFIVKILQEAMNRRKLDDIAESIAPRVNFRD
jgi:hypothetical protein